MEIDEIKEFILDEISYLEICDQEQIGWMIYEKHPDAVKEYPDGTRLFLDRLSPTILRYIYNFISQKIL